MLIRAKWIQNTRVLLLSGRFDKSARVPMDTALAAGEGRFCQKVILDFTTVSSMDSAGIGKLLLLYYSLRKKGVILVIHNPRPNVEELLQFVNFPTLIPVTRSQVEVRSVA